MIDNNTMDLVTAVNNLAENGGYVKFDGEADFTGQGNNEDLMEYTVTIKFDKGNISVFLEFEDGSDFQEIFDWVDEDLFYDDLTNFMEGDEIHDHAFDYDSVTATYYNN